MDKKVLIKRFSEAIEKEMQQYLQVQDYRCHKDM